MREYDDPDGDPPGEGDPWEPEDEPELITTEDFLGPDGLPLDARRMGLDRNTQEGALIAFAGSLDSTKTLHKVVAWVLLLGLAVPMAFGLGRPFY